MKCWNCRLNMKKVKDKFHGFDVEGWKCNKCKEVIYDEKVIQPILKYNKLKTDKKKLKVTIGVLGKSKIFRIPKIAEQIYNLNKGSKYEFDLKSNELTIKLKN